MVTTWVHVSGCSCNCLNTLSAAARCSATNCVSLFLISAPNFQFLYNLSKVHSEKLMSKPYIQFHIQLKEVLTCNCRKQTKCTVDEHDTLHNKVCMRISRKNSQMWSFSTLILVKLFQLLLALDGVLALELNIYHKCIFQFVREKHLPSLHKTPFQNMLRPFNFIRWPSFFRRFRWPRSLLPLCNLLIKSVKVMMHLTWVTWNCFQVTTHGPSHIVLTQGRMYDASRNNACSAN